MPFGASCSCPRHVEWKHGEITSHQLRQCTREETKWLQVCGVDERNKGRKRKICVSCRSRLEIELKYKKLEDNFLQEHNNDNSRSNEETEPEAARSAEQCRTDDMPSDDNIIVNEFPEATSAQGAIPVSQPVTSDKGTQKPSVPIIPYKDQCERRKREMRADVIDTLKDAAMKYVSFVPGDITEFVQDTVSCKRWNSTFKLAGEFREVDLNPTLQALIKEYKDSVCKENTKEARKRLSDLQAKIYIGNTFHDSRITLTGEKTPATFNNRTEAAKSVGRLTSGADERRRLLSIVVMDYPYRCLQQLFGCSSKTVTAAKVHQILFGRGGTPPSKFKFTRQCVSPEVLKELSEFFNRDSVSRPSSCRSVVVNDVETPIRYWKDDVKQLVNQYLLEFPNGVKRTYIYTHLPANFCYNTMLAGLCNLCDEFGHANFAKLTALLTDVERATSVPMTGVKAKVAQHQRYMKTQFSKQAERHSACLELCMDHAFGSCTQSHDSSCPDATALYEVYGTVSDLLTSSSATSTDLLKLSEELKGIMKVHVNYVGHLLRTKHQGEYHKFILNNLQPGEAVVIVDYKMKLEMGVRAREIQRDWYGKRGISLHGFLVIAQVEEDKKVTEVIDLWSEDTKQDAWFSQSAMDVGFRWLEKQLPGFRVYLFSDNGPHYHNTGFLLYLAEVNEAFNFTLVEYNNFEAGEGKSQLDTHFAHISHKIVRWVRVGNNLESGNQLGELVGSMKNVTCRKLLIDRQRAPEKLGTLKDISLFGSFMFPPSGGLVARSLAGLGKEMKKTKQQLQVLANRTRPIAGATGAVTSDEIPVSSSNSVQQAANQEIYSIKFIQHASGLQQPSTSSVTPVNADINESLPKAGFALKTGGGRRTVFTLEQKETMIEFYNRQANHGIRADPAECIAAMRERGLDVLKESQVKSWWSSYHQKRKQEMERMAATVQTLRHAATGTVTSTPPRSTPTVSPPVLSSPATSHSASVQPSSAVVTPPSGVQVTSTCTATIPTPAVVSEPSTLPMNSATNLTGTEAGNGITEWYFPAIVSQSSLNGRNGSNSCVFIALNFGLLYKVCNLPCISGQHLNSQWQTALQTAITIGNGMHDDLYDGQGINVTVEDAIAAVGNHCQVRGILRDYDIFGRNPVNQLKTVVQSILQVKPSFNVMVLNSMAMLIIVDSEGTLVFVDSHQHCSMGALVARCIPYIGSQAEWFAIWFNQMLLQSFGVGISICSVSTISYM